jgi:hypothetical protein
VLAARRLGEDGMVGGAAVVPRPPGQLLSQGNGQIYQREASLSFAQLAAIASRGDLGEFMLTKREDIDQTGWAKIVGPDTLVEMHGDLDIDMLDGVIHLFGYDFDDLFD